MNSNPIDIFNSLETIDWRIVANTYGNNHSTLIGLIVHWWISQSPEQHQVLEGAPPHGFIEEGIQKLGQGDALLCQDRKPVGVVEVEGTRWPYTARKIGHYFDSQVPRYEDINFGVLMMYVTGAKGRGTEKAFPSAAHPETIGIVEDITAKRPGKAIIVITLDKRLLHVSERIIDNHYYSGEPSKIVGDLYVAGKIIKKHDYYIAEPHA